MGCERRRCAPLVLCSLAVIGCASDGEPRADARFVRMWARYAELPRERALAIAGDPDRRWVGSAVGGRPTRAAAESAAFAECDQQRIERRIQQPCRLYAVGDDIVWERR